MKRALEVAAAGGHNLILLGPPGSGKTMMARRLPSILPPLSVQEALEATKIALVSLYYLSLCFHHTYHQALSGVCQTCVIRKLGNPKPMLSPLRKEP